MTLLQAEIVLALAKNNLNIKATARELYRSLSTIYYHIYTIIDQSGLDPRNFYDLCELLPYANAVMEAKHGH